MLDDRIRDNKQVHALKNSLIYDYNGKPTFDNLQSSVLVTTNSHYLQKYKY